MAKSLSPKQKKIASIAGNKNEIDAKDLAVLRKSKKTSIKAVTSRTPMNRKKGM